MKTCPRTPTLLNGKKEKKSKTGSRFDFHVTKVGSPDVRLALDTTAFQKLVPYPARGCAKLHLSFFFMLCHSIF